MQIKDLTYFLYVTPYLELHCQHCIMVNTIWLKFLLCIYITGCTAANQIPTTDVLISVHTNGTDWKGNIQTWHSPVSKQKCLRKDVSLQAKYSI
jgi:hypothetical protein